MTKLRENYAFQLVSVALVYFVLAWLGLYKLSFPTGPSLIWPPAGFGLAALIYSRGRAWPAILLALVALISIQPIPVAARVGFVVANFVEVSLAAWVLSQSWWFDRKFSTLKDVFRFLITVTLSAVAGASISSIGLSISGIADHGSPVHAWVDWFVADLFSMVVLTPIFLSWDGLKEELAIKSWPEFFHLFVQVVVLVVAEIFLLSPDYERAVVAQIATYGLFVGLILFSIRWGRYRGILFLILTSIYGAFQLLSGHGPFDIGTDRENLILFQAAGGITMIVILLIGAALMHLQAALEASKEALAVRDDFLAIASHELNTPLSPIKLQLQYLQRLLTTGTLASVPQEGVLFGLGLALKEVRRFETLTCDLLDVSRIGKKKLELRLEKQTDLSDLVRRVISRYQFEMREAGCAVQVDLQPGILGFWDEVRLEQVVANLLTNAIKYGGGTPVEVRTSAGDLGAELSVRDHGIGIAQENQKKIFERFARVARIESYGGLGLGLYITRELVEGHGGSIKVKSSLGAGSTFTVNLPLSRA